MNKPEIIEKMSQVSGLSKADEEKSFNAFVDVVTESMGNKKDVNISGFAKFFVVDVPKREHVKIQTGEKFTTPAHKTVKVKVGKTLKESCK